MSGHEKDLPCTSTQIYLNLLHPPPSLMQQFTPVLYQPAVQLSVSAIRLETSHWQTLLATPLFGLTSRWQACPWRGHGAGASWCRSRLFRRPGRWRAPCLCPGRCRGWWWCPEAAGCQPGWRAGKVRSRGCWRSGCRRWTSSSCQRSGDLLRKNTVLLADTHQGRKENVTILLYIHRSKVVY